MTDHIEKVDELEPCPFCGGKAEHYIPSGIPSPYAMLEQDYGKKVAGCPNCKIFFKNHSLLQCYKQWNNRPIEQALQKWIDELEKGVDRYWRELDLACEILEGYNSCQSDVVREIVNGLKGTLTQE